MNIRYGLLLALAPVLMASECEDSNSKQSQAQEHMLVQATNSVGMPAITNFQERRMLKEILELRDTTLVTTTYIVDLYGKLHKICDSIGYGIPYATQYTNPSYVSTSAGHYEVLPQADPNGLFSPAASEGTWVNCTNPNDKKSQVVYVEPRVVVSPFPLTIN